MPSCDETVDPAEVRKIFQQVREEGWRRALETLEMQEPVLAGFALAQSYNLDQRLRALWMPRRPLLLIENEMMTAQLTCIASMREAARKLWSDFLPTVDQEIER